MEEVEDPPFFSGEGDSDENEIDHSDRCWTNDDGGWMTSFPPPAGFTGYESCEWGEPDETYARDCTPEDSALLEADAKRLQSLERSDDEERRDEWFALLRSDLALANETSSPAPTPASARPARGSSKHTPASP